MKAPTPQGEALWTALTEAANKAPRKKRGKNRVRKDAAFKRVMEELRLIAADVSTPWHPVAVVLPVHHIRCKCGSLHRVVTSAPLVRFQHERTHALEERADHASRYNPSLPRELRPVDLTVDHCEHCFESTSADDEQIQLDLFADINVPRDRIPVPVTTAPVPPPCRPQVKVETITRIVHVPQSAHYFPLTVYTGEPK